MKKSILSIAIAISSGFMVQGSILITDFGSAGLTTESSSFPTTNLTASSLTLIGDTSGEYYGTLSSPVNLTSILSPSMNLTLTGTFTGTPPDGQFGISLFDSDGNLNQYNGFYAGFAPAGSPQTVTLTLASAEGFNGIVNLIGFAGPGGTDSVNLQLTNLSAVPEPSTYALMALGGLILFFIARRRKAHQQA